MSFSVIKRRSEDSVLQGAHRANALDAAYQAEDAERCYGYYTDRADYFTCLRVFLISLLTRFGTQGQLGTREAEPQRVFNRVMGENH